MAKRNDSAPRKKSKTATNGTPEGGLLSLPVALRENPTADPKRWMAAGGKPTCQGCAAHCCRYISVEIDRPEAKWQWDQAFWMLLHENVSIYVEEDNTWYVEFRTRCRALTDSNLCGVYANRPRLCRDYSNETCPVWGEGDPHKWRWESVDELAEWLDRRGVKWRYQDGAGFEPRGVTRQRPDGGSTERVVTRSRSRARSGGKDRGRGRSPRA